VPKPTHLASHFGYCVYVCDGILPPRGRNYRKIDQARQGLSKKCHESKQKLDNPFTFFPKVI
jgi:hypothetical protein